MSQKLPHYGYLLLGLDRPHDLNPPPVGLRVSTDSYIVRDARTAIHLGLHLLVEMQDPRVVGPSTRPMRWDAGGVAVGKKATVRTY